MMARHPNALGSLLALLALVMQIGFGATLPRSNVDAVLAAATICHADDGGGAPAAPHTPDCVLCPLCTTVAGSVIALSATGIAVPVPHVVAAPRSVRIPHDVEPRSPSQFAARPRGPPVQA